MENVVIFENEFDSCYQAYLALLRYNYDNNIRQVIGDVKYVDVGAGMPEYYSNSLLFRKLSCKIIAIEPIPSFCKLFRDKGWDVLEYAVTKDDSQAVVLFTEMRYNEVFCGLAGSSIKSINKDAIKSPDKIFHEYEVNTLSLNSILKKHHPELKRIDILDIDIEGSEIDILKEFDFDKYKPKVIIIENHEPETNGYYEFYKKIKYKLLYKCSHNDILIRE